MKKIKHLTGMLSILSLISVVIFWKFNLILLFVLLIISAILLLSKKLKIELKLFLYCGLLGATAEIIAIHYGAWAYTKPNFINIPIWLPLVWGIASVFIIRFFNFLKRNNNERTK